MPDNTAALETDARAARLARDIDAALARLVDKLRTDRDGLLARLATGKPSLDDSTLLAKLGLDAARYAPPPEDPTGPRGG